MSFLWPQNLWLLLALPVLPALYLWLVRRRRTQVLRLGSVHVARLAAAPGWRRHVPPALLFVGLAVLLGAVARPTASVALPWAKSTVMLGIDASLSMRVADVKPTRMVAAQDAARTFLREVPKDIDVGIVTFAGSAQVAQAPTIDRPSLFGAVDAIQMQLGTAVGSAIVLCVAELFPDHGISLGEMTFGARRRARGLDQRDTPSPRQVTPVPPGSYDAAAIILLTDGRRTTGIDTLEAARLAADRGVRIYVVGLGTVNGMASSDEGMAIYLQLDEPTLREVARMTAGEYFHAGTADDLRRVYAMLGSRLQMRERKTELTALVSSVGALFLVAASALSLAWFGRVS